MDLDLIEISDSEEAWTLLDNIAPNPAIEDFIFIEDSDEDDHLPAPTSSRPAPRPPTGLRRNETPQPPKVYIDNCKLTACEAQFDSSACTLKIGDTVELAGPNLQGLQPGDFLRIIKIIKDLETDEITLRGLQFRRNRFLQPMLPRKLNEVHLVASIDSGDSRHWYEQGCEEVKLDCVVKKRQMVITGVPYPGLSFREYRPYDSSWPDAKREMEDIIENEVLVCRNIFLYIFADGERTKTRSRPYQGMLRFVSGEEADSAGGLLTGRGPTVDDDLVVVDPPCNRPAKQGSYTMADMFQGCGGASYAAKLAGCKIRYGLDFNAQAVATARKNFRGARIFHMNATDFPPPDFDPYVDILHISPPCQPYSPARNHVEYAANDDDNIAALFTVGKILRAVKPRLVTLEETFGLLTHDKHQAYFQILVSLIAQEGYSIRWAVLNFKEYGLPQPRRRLVFIAAAPGVVLPEFPKPTHGEPGSGLLPFVTARDSAGHFPRNVTNHQPELAKRVNRAPWNPDMPSRRTILTSNSDCAHWSGCRLFTNRELASLQGFPHSYEFCGTKTEVEKQIGNAVPPSCFKRIFEQCIKVLPKVDREQNRREGIEDEPSVDVDWDDIALPSSQHSGASSGMSSDDAIVIDDEDDQDVIVLD